MKEHDNPNSADTAGGTAKHEQESDIMGRSRTAPEAATLVEVTHDYLSHSPKREDKAFTVTTSQDIPAKTGVDFTPKRSPFLEAMGGYAVYQAKDKLHEQEAAHRREQNKEAVQRYQQKLDPQELKKRNREAKQRSRANQQQQKSESAK